MDNERRARIIEQIRKMRENTVGRGCTPGEAAKFAAKAAELVEQYQISEAELSAEAGTTAEVEVTENLLRTGKRVFNPGMTAVVSGLARGMGCKVILLEKWSDALKAREAVYGIIGDHLDADYCCQVALTVVPALQVMARWEGAEHGHERGELVKWCNQYLTGAGYEIQQRLIKDRKDRHDAAEAQHRATIGDTGRALVLVTGHTLMEAKKAATQEAFAQMYPKTKKVHSRTAYDHTAHEAGRAAGRKVGLGVQLNGPRPSYHNSRHIIGP